MLGETESGVTPVRRGENRVEVNGAQVGQAADLVFFFGVSNVKLWLIVAAALAPRR
jgi:hypothetical protein